MQTLNSLLKQIEKVGNDTIVIGNVVITKRTDRGVDVAYGSVKGFLIDYKSKLDIDKTQDVDADRLHIHESFDMINRQQFALDLETIARALDIPTPEASPLIIAAEAKDLITEKDLTIARLEGKVEMYQDLLVDKDRVIFEES